MNITLNETKITQDSKNLAFEKNNGVDEIVITVDTDETWSYKLDVKYPDKYNIGNDTLYNVIDLDRNGDICSVILTSKMLPFNGKYTMQLRGIKGDKVYHSDTFEAWVKYSIEPGSTYDPVPSEFYQVEKNLDIKVNEAKQYAEVAEKAAVDAKVYADRAATLAADVSEKAAQTAKNAYDAAKAMDAAQTAQRLAEEAQGAAETARTAAETAQAAAETAATDADGAKQAAEAALKATQDAAEEAAQSLEALRTLYEEMQTWAQGVIRDANAAADSASQSATSAAGSASAASEAQSAAETAQRGAEEAKTKAEASKEASAKSEAAAKLSEQNAKASEDAAKASETASAGSASAAADSATAAQAAQSGAEASQSAAEQSAQQAAESAAVYDNVVADVNQLKQDIADITPDDTAVDGKPWTSKKIVDSLCQPIEETGNPVQVYPVEGYPLGVKVQIEPTQEGSGDPSPDNIRPITGRDTVSVTRCGKNLLHCTNNSQNEKGIEWIEKADGSLQIKGSLASGAVAIAFYLDDITRDNIYAAIRSGMTVTVSGIPKGVSLAIYDSEWVGNGGGPGKEITFPSGMGYPQYVYFQVRSPEHTFNGTYYPQIELGGTVTRYEMYVGSSTTDIALPKTVYGGTLDVETGVLTVTHGHISSYAGEPLPGVWMSDRDVYTDGTTPTVGAQVVYELAEPYTIQLTPQQITALSGVNTIYTDADGVIVTGAEDPKHTITELKNAIISLGGNV